VTITDLHLLYDYGYWANAELLRVLSQLTPAQFTQPVAGSYGSIRNTMVHTLSAEWGWLGRCGGPPRGPRLNPDNYPTLQSVVDEWARIEAHVRTFLSTLTDTDLLRPVEFTNDRSEKRSMPLGELMHHAAAHGMHHRGQIALMLRELGHAPGDFDLLFYYASKRGVPAW
jgi:uncharacterized damage-inducible protein DinB